MIFSNLSPLFLSCVMSDKGIHTHFEPSQHSLTVLYHSFNNPTHCMCHRSQGFYYINTPPKSFMRIRPLSPSPPDKTTKNTISPEILSTTYLSLNMCRRIWHLHDCGHTSKTDIECLTKCQNFKPEEDTSAGLCDACKVKKREAEAEARKKAAEGKKV